MIQNYLIEIVAMIMALSSFLTIIFTDGNEYSSFAGIAFSMFLMLIVISSKLTKNQ